MAKIRKEKERTRGVVISPRSPFSTTLALPAAPGPTNEKMENTAALSVPGMLYEI